MLLEKNDNSYRSNRVFLNHRSSKSFFSNDDFTDPFGPINPYLDSGHMDNLESFNKSFSVIHVILL